LLAGLEPGVLARWPDGQAIPRLAADAELGGVGGAAAADVTGGMAGKVVAMQTLARDLPGMVVRIFSGEEPGLVQAALLGRADAGTLIQTGPNQVPPADDLGGGVSPTM
jgi:isopentenyl phosphate kinase